MIFPRVNLTIMDLALSHLLRACGVLCSRSSFLSPSIKLTDTSCEVSVTVYIVRWLFDLDLAPYATPTVYNKRFRCYTLGIIYKLCHIWDAFLRSSDYVKYLIDRIYWPHSLCNAMSLHWANRFVTTYMHEIRLIYAGGTRRPHYAKQTYDTCS